jgi:DNA-binding transcriptional regulator YiaG
MNEASTAGSEAMSNSASKNAQKKAAVPVRIDGSDTAMPAGAFKAWRKSLGLSQKEAAAALGLKRRAVQYYEKGERGGDPVPIPKTVRLACYALAQGCADYAGPAAEG